MNRHEIKVFIQALRRYSQKDSLLLPILIASNVLQVLIPFFSIILVSLLLDDITTGSSIQELIRTAVIGCAVIFLVGQIYNYIMKKRSERWLRTWPMQVEWLIEKNLTMDYELMEDSQAQFLLRKQQDYQSLQGGICNQLFSYAESLTQTFTTMLASLILAVPMFLTSGLLGILIPAIMLLMIVFLQEKEGSRSNQKTKASTDKWLQTNRLGSYYTNTLLDNYETGKDIRIFHQQDLIEQELEKCTAHRKEMQKQNFLTNFRYAGIIDGITSLNGCLLYLFSGFIALGGSLTLGNAVKYINGITRFIDSFTEFTNTITNIKRMIPYAEDVEAYLNLEQRRVLGTIPVEKRRDNKFSLEFRNVSFRYPNAKEYALKNINLKLEIGDRVAIVGPNGSGKSTFIKLLCRLYDPTEGEILLNGIDIRKYDEKEYLAILAVVFQDYHIFSLKIGENIAASPDVDEARAISSMEKAGLEMLLSKLPDGVNTYVGKHFSPTGFALSGGEKQKLAIARAIYHSAPFVIMDEPTAALDPVAEYEVFAGFDRLVGSRTAFYISHRLASCRFCKNILVFEQGQIVQQGSHESLLHQDGLYAQLWNAQAQYYT